MLKTSSRLQRVQSEAGRGAGEEPVRRISNDFWEIIACSSTRQGVTGPLNGKSYITSGASKLPQYTHVICTQVPDILLYMYFTNKKNLEIIMTS